MTEHHDNAHNLTTFIGIGVAVGAALGAAFGAAFGNVSLGVALGPGIGIVLAVTFWCLRQTPMERDDARK